MLSMLNADTLGKWNMEHVARILFLLSVRVSCHVTGYKYSTFPHRHNNFLTLYIKIWLIFVPHPSTSASNSKSLCLPRKQVFRLVFALRHFATSPTILKEKLNRTFESPEEIWDVVILRDFLFVYRPIAEEVESCDIQVACIAMLLVFFFYWTDGWNYDTVRPCFLTGGSAPLVKRGVPFLVFRYKIPQMKCDSHLLSALHYYNGNFLSV